MSESVSNKIKEKIKDGNWHTSFSKKNTYDYNGIKLQGKWELIYAKWLDLNSIKWRRPTETFKYIFENKEHRYTPDFYLIDECCYVEIKGYKTIKDEEKWKQFPVKLKILMGKDLFELGLIKTYRKQNIKKDPRMRS